ncbi:response regulator [Rhizobium lentis]|uniref:response regulator n=1 Tax=Rhizobium lentis TaxID=1138194 RepID=UPI002180D7EA|nr:response regulator [Rhizobium lentis]
MLYVHVIVSKGILRRWRLRAKSSRLPMQDALMVDDSAETSEKIISGDGSKLLVLVAEDEFLIRANLEDVVTEAGFEHLAVSNADEAILALEEDSAHFCALITDVRMPGETDGWDLARRARELQPLLPVIYMTGDSAKEWAAQGVPNSVLLQKPFVHAQLITALTTLLNDASMSGIGQ